MEFFIQHTWDSEPVTHDPIRIDFSPGQGGLKIEMFGPFFNDPAGPDSPPSQAFPGLWNYEGGSSGDAVCTGVSALHRFHIYL